VREVTAVVPTHPHDDHVCGIPLLQRLKGVECWAPENFAALLERPDAHRFPCTWPQPIHVDRRLRLADEFEWEGIRFRFAPMSGHTQFSALIGWEAAGVRYAHVGDQYAPFAPAAAPSSWTRPAFWAVYVYSNGAFLDSYRRSAEWLAAFRPDIVVSGHGPPVHTDAAYFEHLAEYGERYEATHRQVMALDDEVEHFDLAARPGWVWPYRVHIPAAEEIAFEVTVRNPLPDEAPLVLTMSGPEGWRGTTATVIVPGREEAVVPMRIVPSGECRRQPVVVDLRAGGRPFGQVLEALVTIGDTPF
jgi:glyoxylase-like metal-dependent hydrolase (beta-lactamase superfamily II)